MCQADVGKKERAGIFTCRTDNYQLLLQNQQVVIWALRFYTNLPLPGRCYAFWPLFTFSGGELPLTRILIHVKVLIEPEEATKLSGASRYIGFINSFFSVGRIGKGTIGPIAAWGPFQVR
ncbi:MAG TPA: hypothetical protein DCM07_12480 [Planctomycetaceae bacterium]|nr:hypothetical protein [Gimesia sp.]HAH45647.1 hypothetical protein [Planctomycetaceae bacterium]|tara:strand:+ start:780 stop:1139 length:360 start_codon:yes stop_codon:yes gene_type:complete